MALQPVKFLQTAAGTTGPGYDATMLRHLIRQLIPFEGVVNNGDFLVTQRGAGANMSVDIAAGEAFIQGDDIARQGVYHLTNDGVINVTVPTADPVNPRIDRVVGQVLDATIIGGGSDGAQPPTVLAGTPTAGAALLTNEVGMASLPNTTIELARVLVAAGASSIANASIRNTAFVLSQQLTVPETINFLSLQTGFTWTSPPAALTEFPGNLRQRADLSRGTQARLSAHITTAAGATHELRAQYSLDNGSTWNYLDNTAGPGAVINTLGTNSNGVIVGSWVNINAAARADVLLRIVGINGNGTTPNPVIRSIILQVR